MARRSRDCDATCPTSSADRQRAGVHRSSAVASRSPQLKSSFQISVITHMSTSEQTSRSVPAGAWLVLITLSLFVVGVVWIPHIVLLWRQRNYVPMEVAVSRATVTSLGKGDLWIKVSVSYTYADRKYDKDCWLQRSAVIFATSVAEETAEALMRKGYVQAFVDPNDPRECVLYKGQPNLMLGVGSLISIMCSMFWINHLYSRRKRIMASRSSGATQRQ